ncbi:MAG: hypothetical protein WBZ01_21465 [Terriglobales bacterium]
MALTHQQEYERATKTLKELLAEQDRLTGKILEARRQVFAWGTILKLHNNMPMGRGRLTDAIRRILNDAKGPLGTNDIVTELRKLGFPMEKHSNPAATVNAIGNRLVTQKFAQKAKLPGGKKGKAWEARKVEIYASLIPPEKM